MIKPPGESIFYIHVHLFLSVYVSGVYTGTYIVIDMLLLAIVHDVHNYSPSYILLGVLLSRIIHSCDYIELL